MRAIILSCASNQRQLHASTTLYLDEWNGWFPYQGTLPHDFILRHAPSYGSNGRSYWEEFWPVDLRACPTAPLSDDQIQSNFFYFNYSVVLSQANGSSPWGGTYEAGYCQIDRPGRIKFSGPAYDPLKSLPLFADPICYYFPKPNAFIAHTKDGTDSYFSDPGNFSAPIGQNAIWMDGHLEWHDWPKEWFDLSQAPYAWNVVGRDDFPGGFVRVDNPYYLTWALPQ